MAARGVTVKDVSASEFIAAYARHLKRSGRVDVPKWADHVKTGTHKELAPYDPDWFYVRTAAMARQVYIRGNIGIGGFTRIYGGNKQRGSRPNKATCGSGAVASAALKNLQKLQVVEVSPKGGRVLTQIGRRDLDRIAGQIVNKSAKQEK